MVLHEAAQSVLPIDGLGDLAHRAIADQRLVLHTPLARCPPGGHAGRSLNLEADTRIARDEIEFSPYASRVEEEGVRRNVIPVGHRDEVGLVGNREGQADDALTREDRPHLGLARDLPFRSAHALSIRARKAAWDGQRL